jgi:hypothetical protein
MDSGSSCQLGCSFGVLQEFYRGGLEGAINGLPKPIMGLLGTRIVYETKKG